MGSYALASAVVGGVEKGGGGASRPGTDQVQGLIWQIRDVLGSGQRIHIRTLYP
jgi:hypothetical protein